MPVKQHSEPHPAWHSAWRSGPRPEPVAGRGELLARGREQLTRGGSVLPPGPAGIGKSTVLRALAAELSVGGLAGAQAPLGTRRHAALPDSVLREIHRASGGNPFFALQLARALAESGTESGTEPSAESCAALRPREPLPVPPAVRDLVLDRLRALPTAGRRTLLIASAADRPTVALLRAAGRAEAAALGLLDREHREHEPHAADAADAGHRRQAGRHHLLGRRLRGGRCPGRLHPADHLLLAGGRPGQLVGSRRRFSWRRTGGRTASSGSAGR